MTVKLKKELFWYETVYQLVRLDENGRNLLVSSADEQWKRIDRLNRDGREYLKNNFYRNETIKSLLLMYENQILNNEITSFVAAKKLLDTYFKLNR